MVPDFEAKLSEYARLLVEVGLNVQPGQTPSIESNVEYAALTRMCVSACYDCGARNVVPYYGDDFTTRESFLRADGAVFEEYPSYMKARVDWFLEQKSPRLSFTGSNPELLKGVDPARIQARRKASGPPTKPYFDALTANKFQWCVGAHPTPAWAEKVFPGRKGEDAMDALAWEGVSLISNRDIPTPDRIREPWGLCQMRPDGVLRSLAAPYWHWGNFYVKLIRGIFSGNWDALSSNGERAVNYWWGMKSRVVDVILSDMLPDGVGQLVQILRRGVMDGSIDPFQRFIRDQSGKVRNDGSAWFSPEAVLHMDWLCDSVDGSIPPFEDILPMSETIVRLQGVYRDRIPPKKEGPLL